MANPTKIFKFSVDNAGNFTFDPSTDWEYDHTDTIRFQTGSGAFTIAFLPDSVVPVAGFNPLGGPLTSSLNGGVHMADTHVTDTLSVNDRQTLKKNSRSSSHPNGIVARYKYDIKVNVGGQNRNNVQKNGSYTC